MAGRASKQKGWRFEHEIVNLHVNSGIPAKRMPLSGALGGEWGGDVVVDDMFRAECKSRKDGQGFVVLERWLGERDCLFLRRNYAEPLVLLPWKTWLLLLTERAELLRRETEHGTAVQGA